MNSNLKLGRRMEIKLAAGTQTLADNALIALADALAGLFPEVSVYISPVRQNLNLPAWFVRFYDISSGAKLDGDSEYTFGFDLAYWPKDSGSDGELRDALYLAQRLRELPGEDGGFSVYRRSGSVTDRVAHITGAIRALEQEVPDDPYITKARKEVRI